MIDGERQWKTLRFLDDDDSDFAKIGEDFSAAGDELQGPVGSSVGRLMRSRDLVDFGVSWMLINRG